MKIKVLAFGQIAEVTGVAEMHIGEIYNTNELRHKLVQLFPEANGLHYSIAINKKVVHENTEINEGDIVALMPPFSGG